MNRRHAAALVAIVLGLAQPTWGEVSDRFPLTLTVEQRADRLIIKRDVAPVATYVLRDEMILRPYFSNVYAPGSVPITRNHPPQQGVDAVDHADMHPGIWLAFGDLGGADFWRNKGRVEHVEFVERPNAKIEDKDGVVSFVAKNRYVAGEQVICEELARHSIRATRQGFLFTFDSTFSGPRPFAFGDQEEMGLGLRLATNVAVKNGGAILSSDGKQNEKQVWGTQPAWCNYSGVVTTKLNPPWIDGTTEWQRRAGLLLVPHPDNFRPCWMHARDYGLLVANPFGQKAFTKGPVSRIGVEPGQSLRLRFGVWAHSFEKKADLDELAKQYQTLAEKRK